MGSLCDGIENFRQHAEETGQRELVRLCFFAVFAAAEDDRTHQDEFLAAPRTQHAKLAETDDRAARRVCGQHQSHAPQISQPVRPVREARGTSIGAFCVDVCEVQIVWGSPREKGQRSGSAPL